MHPLAQRLSQIAPSPTLALDVEAKAMKAAGQDVISFGVGEPDFETPDHIKEAAVKAIRDGFTRYTAVDGIVELKEAICQKFENDNGLKYTPNQIVVSNGGKHTLYNIMLTLFQEGDEVILPTPCWVSYAPQISLAGAKPVFVKTLAENNYNLTPEDLKAAITPKTRGLIITSPSNPTGAIYSADTLAPLAEIILEHKLWVISDDIYEKIIFDGHKFINLPMLDERLYPQTIIAHGLAKTYAMTGWRLGFMAGPENVARAITRLQSHTTSNPCSISQKAAVAAMTGPQDAVATMTAHFDRRRKLVVSLLNDIPGIKCPMPQGAFYVFPDMSKFLGRRAGDEFINSSDDLAAYLLKSAKVAIVPGTGFCDERAMRLSYALSDEDIKRGLARVKDALTNLK